MSKPQKEKLHVHAESCKWHCKKTVWQPQKECLVKNTDASNNDLDMSDFKKPQKEESWEKEYMILNNGCLLKKERLEAGSFTGGEETRKSLRELLSSHRQSTIAQCIEVLEEAMETAKQTSENGSNNSIVFVLSLLIEKLSQLNEKGR